MRPFPVAALKRPPDGAGEDLTVRVNSILGQFITLARARCSLVFSEASVAWTPHTSPSQKAGPPHDQAHFFLTDKPFFSLSAFKNIDKKTSSDPRFKCRHNKMLVL